MSNDFKLILLVGLVIIFGATANALTQLAQARKSSSKFDFLDFVIAMTIAAFAGTMFGLGAAYIWSDVLPITAISGMGAFLGLKGLNAASEILIEALAKRVSKGDK